MNQHTIVTTYKSEGGTTLAKTAIVEAELSQNLELVVPAGSTDLQVDAAVTITNLKSICMTCSKVTGATGTFTQLTVETNSGSAPADTFVLTPANGLVWSYGDPNANPIGTAITSMYVTNAGTADANFVLRALHDPTP